jgi:hypothetical protein
MNYFNNEERAAKAFAEFEAVGCEGAMIRDRLRMHRGHVLAG